MDKCYICKKEVEYIYNDHGYSYRCEHCGREGGLSDDIEYTCYEPDGNRKA